MASAKTYVNVEKISVKDVFDSKYKSALPGIMQKCAEKAVKSSGKLTLDEPKEKGAKGYSLSGSLVSLGPDKSGKKLAGEVMLVVATWPDKSIKAMPAGKGGFEIDDIAIEAVEDPDVKGVVCHVAYFNRSLIDRLQQGNWFEDPSYSAIDCAASGPVTRAIASPASWRRRSMRS